jgi:hypothetical protein
MMFASFNGLDSFLPLLVIKKCCIHDLIEKELLAQVSGMDSCCFECGASMADLCSETVFRVVLVQIFITDFDVCVFQLICE